MNYKILIVAVLLQIFHFESFAKQISDFDFSVKDSKVVPAASWVLQSKNSTRTAYTQSSGDIEKRLVIRSTSTNETEGVLGVETIGTNIQKLELLRFSAVDKRPESLTKCDAGECYSITRTYCEGLLRKFPQKMIKQLNSCVAIEENWESFLGQKSIQDDLVSAQIKDLELARSIDSSLASAPLKHLSVGANLFYLLSTLDECRSALNAVDPAGDKKPGQKRRTAN